MAAAETTAGPGIRLRAIGIGFGLVALIAVALPYNEMLIKGSRLGLSSLTPAAFFLFFVWIIAVNPAFARFLPALALRRGELLVIFAMMMVATAIPTRGVTGVMLAMISGPHYYASPENGWTDLVLPHVKPWIVVPPGPGLRHFFEGVPENADPEWGVWLRPLSGWLILLLGLWVAVICLMVLLRRQWVERERLAFPVMQVPLAMVRDVDRFRWPPFFRDWRVWVGFAIPFTIGLFDGLHHYFPAIPGISFNAPRILALRNTVNIVVRLNPLMFAFAYLVNTRLSLSLWVFYLLSAFARGACEIVGLSNNEKLGVWTQDGQVGPIFAHQSMGAMLVFVAVALWTARHHLRNAIHSARAGNPEPRELLSYRTAWLGLIAGLTVLIGWHAHAGMPLWIATAAVGAAFVIYLSLTRAIVDGGLATIVPAIIPLGFTLSGFGTDALGPAGLASLAFSLVWCGDLLVFMMAPSAHAVRLSTDSGGHGRLFLALIGAMVLSFSLSAVTMIHLGHTYGAANLHQQYFQTFAKYPGDIVASKILNPTTPHVGGWMWTGIGAAAMALLTLAQYRLPWWPLHPLGYMVSPAWIMNSLWFPFLVAWALKSLVIRFGGLNLYDRSRPVIYGVILGQVVIAGLWVIIDIATGTTGNRIRVY